MHKENHFGDRLKKKKKLLSVPSELFEACIFYGIFSMYF